MERLEQGAERNPHALTWAYLREVTRTGQGVYPWLDDALRALREEDPAEARRVRIAVMTRLRELAEAGVVIPGLAVDGVGLVYVRATDVPSYIHDVHPLWRAIRDGTLGTETRDAVRRYAHAWAMYWASREPRAAGRGKTDVDGRTGRPREGGRVMKWIPENDKSWIATSDHGDPGYPGGVWYAYWAGVRSTPSGRWELHVRSVTGQHLEEHRRVERRYRADTLEELMYIGIGEVREDRELHEGHPEPFIAAIRDAIYDAQDAMEQDAAPQDATA